MITDKKTAAAIAAVARYMAAEHPASVTGHENTQAARHDRRPNTWGQSGRQARMDLRGMMQMKMSNRSSSERR